MYSSCGKRLLTERRGVEEKRSGISGISWGIYTGTGGRKFSLLNNPKWVERHRTCLDENVLTQKPHDEALAIEIFPIA